MVRIVLVAIPVYIILSFLLPQIHSIFPPEVSNIVFPGIRILSIGILVLCFIFLFPFSDWQIKKSELPEKIDASPEKTIEVVSELAGTPAKHKTKRVLIKKAVAIALIMFLSMSVFVALFFILTQEFENLDVFVTSLAVGFFCFSLLVCMRIVEKKGLFFSISGWFGIALAFVTLGAFLILIWSHEFNDELQKSTAVFYTLSFGVNVSFLLMLIRQKQRLTFYILLITVLLVFILTLFAINVILSNDRVESNDFRIGAALLIGIAFGIIVALIVNRMPSTEQQSDNIHPTSDN
jgi:hypothetical protein